MAQFGLSKINEGRTLWGVVRGPLTRISGRDDGPNNSKVLGFMKEILFTIVPQQLGRNDLGKLKAMFELKECLDQVASWRNNSDLQ